MTGLGLDFDYNRLDFGTSKPYADVYAIRDPFEQEQARKKLFEVAEFVGYKGVGKAWAAFCKGEKQKGLTINDAAENLTAFDAETIELYTGEWTANETGIYRYGLNGLDYACTHPIQPVERLKNIDTGELKVKLAFRRGSKNRRSWTEITTDFDTVSNSKNIVNLAKIGVSVTSGKRAQSLVDYLADVMDLNYDRIPERKSVSRLGWNEEGFSPYIGDVVFDGNESFCRTFGAVRPHGNFDVWLDEVRRVRKDSLLARIVLAASFASVLVGPMGCLPFFVHLWGMDSSTGKTVAQMVAVSVWAEPSPGGEYFKTFKSTTVGYEVLAGFFRSLPVAIDELQLAKDAKGKVIFNVYELASGSGKLRSNVKLGLAATPRWENCFITSGETPITTEQDGAGAMQRVIEIECRANNKVIVDGHKTAETVKSNYGHAGKIFVERLCDVGVIDRCKERYTELFQAYANERDAGKQAHSAALITLADELATEWMFADGLNVTVQDMVEFLRSKEAISAADRGYAYMCDWVAQNANKLQGKADNNEVYGLIVPVEAEDNPDAGYVYIIRSVFNRACGDAGISAPALLSHLRSRGLIKTRGKGCTCAKRINGVPANCVIMRMQDDTDIILDEMFPVDV